MSNATDRLAALGAQLEELGPAAREAARVIADWEERVAEFERRLAAAEAAVAVNAEGAVLCSEFLRQMDQVAANAARNAGRRIEPKGRI